MTMTKKKLKEKLAQALDCNQADALRFMNAYQSILIEELNYSGEFSLHGIGSLKLKLRTARIGRNPRTGETLEIPEKMVISFKSSASLVKLLNPEI